MQANMVTLLGTIAIDGAEPVPCEIKGLTIQGNPDQPPVVLPPLFPTHPIVIPEPPRDPPLVIWGPTDPRPDQGPITWPGYPAWPPTSPSPQPPPDKWYWIYCDDIPAWVLVPPGGGGRPQPVP